MNLRRSVQNVIFQFTADGSRQLNVWAHWSLVLYLMVVWKILIELDKAMPSEFWVTVLRGDANAIGPNGFALLALYAVGGVVWLFITMLLVKLTGEGARRFAL